MADAMTRLREAGMKTTSFFKGFGAPGKPEQSRSSNNAAAKRSEAEQQLLEICEKFELHGGPHISDIVTARAGDRMLGGLGDEALLQMIWYRQAAGGDFEELKDVKGGFYQPNADDIGARLLCRATARNDAGLSAFGEWGPLSAPPALQDATQDAVAEGELVLTVEREGTYNAPRRLVLTPSQLLLHDTASTKRLLDEEQGGGLAGSQAASSTPADSDSPLDKTLKVPVSAAVSLRLATAAVMSATLQLPAEQCLADGQVVAPDGQTFVQLKFRDPQDRDLLALVLREWSASAADLPAEGGQAADEGGLSSVGEASASSVTEDAASGDDTPRDAPASAAGGLDDDRSATQPEQQEGHEQSVHSAAQAAALQDAQQENEQLSARVASLQRQVDELQSSVKSSKASHNSAKRELKSSAAQVASLQASLSEARNTADSLRRENSKLQVELESASSTASSSGADLAAKAKLIAKLREQLKEAQADTKHAQEKAASMQQRLGASEDRCAQLQKQLNEAKSEGGAAAQEAASLKSALDDVKTQLRAAEKSREEASAAAAAANTKLKTHEGELGSLRGALAEARQASAAASESAQKAAARAEGLQKDLAASQEKSTAAQAELQEAQQRLQAALEVAQQTEEAQARATTAEAELQHARDTVDDITAERNALKRKLASLKRDMQKMSAPAPPPQVDPAQLAALRAEVQDLEAQNKLLRADAAAAVPVPSSPARGSYGGVGGGGGGMSSTPSSSRSFVPAGGLSGSSQAGPEVVAALQRLVADLTSELQDKNEALQMQKATKEALAARITALEGQGQGGK